MKPTSLSFDALSDAVRRLPDDGLTASRQAALEQLREVGTPSIREEDWKYTNITSAIDIANDWLQAGAAQPMASEAFAAMDSRRRH